MTMRTKLGSEAAQQKARQAWKGRGEVRNRSAQHTDHTHLRMRFEKENEGLR